jgi:hypothetical protein
VIHLALWLVSACVIGFFALLALAGIVHLLSAAAKPFQRSSAPDGPTAPKLPQPEPEPAPTGLSDLIAAVSAFQEEQARKAEAERRASAQAADLSLALRPQQYHLLRPRTRRRPSRRGWRCPARPLHAISKARDLEVPDTEAQRLWVSAFQATRR